MNYLQRWTSISPPSYHCFDIKCQWINECVAKDCYLWRIQRAGCWYMCQANKMAEKLYERWGEAALPSIEITHGSGGPTINCFSFIEGTEKQNDALDKELESIQKELRNNERGI